MKEPVQASTDSKGIAADCTGITQAQTNEHLSDDEYLRHHRGTLLVNAAPCASGGGVMRPATDDELLARRWLVLRKDPEHMTRAELEAELGYIQRLLIHKTFGSMTGGISFNLETGETTIYP